MALNMRMNTVCVGILVLAANAALADPLPIQVDFEPGSEIVLLNEIFTLDIVADIDQLEATVGWGIDVKFDESVLTYLGHTIGGDWTEVFAPPDPNDPTVDLDLGAITSWPEPNDGVFGNNVLLATLTFQATALTDPGPGTILTIEDHNPWNGQGDLTEGFALDPPPANNFAQVVYGEGIVQVVPEPATLALIGLGALVFIRRRPS